MKPSDLKWSFRGVTVCETGTYIPFNMALLKDILIWRAYYRAEKKAPVVNQQPVRPVACHPRIVQPHYLLWGAMRQAGLKAMGPEATADLHVYFKDQTYLNEKEGAPAGLNRDCNDISKSKVASVFEDVFGYSLDVDPRTSAPPFVCKSEINGRHDGYITTENCEPKEGWVYQKLIQTETPDGTVLDVRAVMVFGNIPLVYLKERPVNARFFNLNTRCRLADTHDYLSAEEQTLISQFCQKMRLDWGGLDILRDARDGKIYIVDVNKTDMGPPLALPLEEKLRSTRILGQALREAVDLQYPPALETT